MKSIIFTLLILFSYKIFAQTSRIIVRGNVEKESNTLVELKVYEDFVTPVTRTIGFDRSNEKGEFHIEFKSDQTTQYQLVIENQSKIIHLSPGFYYKITINKRLEISSIESEDTTNASVSYMNSEMHNFRIENKIRKFKPSSLIQIKELVDSIGSYIEISNANNYIKDYFKYKRAGLYHDYYNFALADSLELENLEKDLLINSPVLYHNPKYLEFIDHYYFWTFNSVAVGHVQFNTDINPFELFLQELSFIANDTVQQIALLTACKRAYTSHWGPDRTRISQVVDSIKDSGLHKEIKKIASYLNNKYGQDWVGKSVLDFTLFKSPYEAVQLSEYYGKYLFLDFWFSGCSPCIEAMPIKKKLRDRFGDKFEILSIDPVDSFDRMQKWVDKHPRYNWSFLSAYQNRELIDYFRITEYPRYVLLNSEGIVVFAPREFELKNIYDDIKNIINISK